MADIQEWIEDRNMNQAYILLLKKYHTLSSLSLQVLVYTVALGTLFPELGIVGSLRNVITSNTTTVAVFYLGGPVVDVILREVVAGEK